MKLPAVKCGQYALSELEPAIAAFWALRAFPGGSPPIKRREVRKGRSVEDFFYYSRDERADLYSEKSIDMLVFGQKSESVNYQHGEREVFGDTHFQRLAVYRTGDTTYRVGLSKETTGLVARSVSDYRSVGPSDGPRGFASFYYHSCLHDTTFNDFYHRHYVNTGAPRGTW